MTNIPDNPDVFANAVLPQTKRLEQIANENRHPFRLYANAVLTELYQIRNYYVDEPLSEFTFMIEAGLFIASYEN